VNKNTKFTPGKKYLNRPISKGGGGSELKTFPQRKNQIQVDSSVLPNI
jgi:hypothetical protein